MRVLIAPVRVVRPVTTIHPLVLDTKLMQRVIVVVMAKDASAESRALEEKMAFEFKFRISRASDNPGYEHSSSRGHAEPKWAHVSTFIWLET
jgi:hypothetical protein